MSFECVKKLPTPEEMREKFPLTDKLAQLKFERDKQISDVLMGNSDKFLVVIGPCSADNEDAVIDYVSRLAKVYDAVKDKLLIIPRIYTSKPRTKGVGYKGLISQPDPKGRIDHCLGLSAMRNLQLRAIRESGLTAADEMLYPENLEYVSDIISYVAVGARSVESQEHRMAASGCSLPTGMKNPTSGSLNVMLNAVYAAQQEQSFIFRGYEVKTSGNKLAHCVLRGGLTDQGQSIPNYQYDDLRLLLSLYDQREIANPAVIVDANHNNSNKQFKKQIDIVKDVLNSRKADTDIKKLVKGVMIESYIEEGSQKIGEGVYGRSITDPCLGWDDTERLLLEMAEIV